MTCGFPGGSPKSVCGTSLGGGGSAGGGGAGGIPLLTLIVMTEPGMVWPLGVVPTIAPYGAELFTGVVWSAT